MTGDAFGPGDAGDCEAVCDVCGTLGHGLSIAAAGWLGSTHSFTTGHRWTFTMHPGRQEARELWRADPNRPKWADLLGMDPDYGRSETPTPTIMGAGGPRKGWPEDKLLERIERYQHMRSVGDRRIPRDGEVILWLADRLGITREPGRASDADPGSDPSSPSGSERAGDARP